MKTQTDKADDVDHGIQGCGKEQKCSMVEVVRLYSWRRSYKPDLDEVEVNEMEGEKDEYDDAGVEHVL
jgi:hypothetical protein